MATMIPKITIMGDITKAEKEELEDTIEAHLIIREAEGKTLDCAEVSDIVVTLMQNGQFYAVVKGRLL